MPRQLLAILAADVVGYTRLMEADEAGTLAAVKQALSSNVEPAVERNGGSIVKLMGDGVLARFTSVVEAVRCGVEILERAAEIQPEQGRHAIAYRVGVHLGDVLVEDGDIFGTGVNIAARLEALADPGALIISGEARREIEGKLDVSFESIGRHRLKNIERPVEAWRWIRPSALDATKAAQGGGRADALERMSIAVLPFENMSADPEQDYFSDGIAEDVITELSRFPELFVIARNSSFQFRGQALDIREIARKLGVDHVLEGSVRKAGTRVRVTGQLIDAASGAHLWAERFDRQLEDIFEVQDDVVRGIVSVLPGRITAAGVERLKRKPPEDMSAFEHLLRGNHVLSRRGEAIRQAIVHYRNAISADPLFAPAYAGIALAESRSVWDLSTVGDTPLDRALEAGNRALELDANDYRAHTAFGTTMRQLGRHSEARHHLSRAMALNPNSAEALAEWAMLQAYTGDPAGAIASYHAAVRLDPFSEENVRKEILAESYYMLREYERSIQVLKDMLKLPIFYAHQQIAIAYAQLGEKEACNQHMELYRASLPADYDEHLLLESHLRLCALEEDRRHWVEGYRLSGTAF